MISQFEGQMMMMSAGDQSISFDQYLKVRRSIDQSKGKFDRGRSFAVDAKIY